MAGIKIPALHRKALYTLFCVTWCSGITFFILHRFFTVEGEFGTEKHPLQFTVLQWHGACAFLMMVMLGYMFGSHISYAWRVRPRRKLGIALTAMCAFQMLTAYLLYYVAQDASRTFISYLHLSVGGCLPFILAAHVILKIRKKPSR